MHLLNKGLLIALVTLLSNNTLAAINSVNKIVVTSSYPNWLQVSEVVTIVGEVDIATSNRGAVAFSDGSYHTTSIATNAINGIQPAGFLSIYYSLTPEGTEYLLIILNDSYVIDKLDIYGRTDGGWCVGRDTYNVNLFDANDNRIYSADGQDACNEEHEVIVFDALQRK